MFDPREEFSTAQYRRYSAECRRLAAIARPPAKRGVRKPTPSDWFGAVANQFRAPAKRERKLVTTWAHR
jgi:hypothetical protein